MAQLLRALAALAEALSWVPMPRMGDCQLSVFLVQEILLLASVCTCPHTSIYIYRYTCMLVRLQNNLFFLLF